MLWHPEYYNVLWTFAGLPEREAEPGIPGERPFENIIIPAMRRYCLIQADYALEEFGIPNSDWNRLIVGKAIAAALQRAHFVLKRRSEGIFEPGEEPPDPRQTVASDEPTAAVRDNGSAKPTTGPAHCPQESLGSGGSLTGLFEVWWLEAKAAGRKPSTYESYGNTFSVLVAFLGHDDAGRISRSDVIRFKDHRLTTPSVGTGKPVSARIVKDSDPSAESFADEIDDILAHPAEVRTYLARYHWAVERLKTRLEPRALNRITFPEFPLDFCPEPVSLRPLSAITLRTAARYKSGLK